MIFQSKISYQSKIKVVVIKNLTFLPKTINITYCFQRAMKTSFNTILLQVLQIKRLLKATFSYLLKRFISITLQLYIMPNNKELSLKTKASRPVILSYISPRCLLNEVISNFLVLLPGDSIMLSCGTKITLNVTMRYCVRSRRKLSSIYRRMLVANYVLSLEVKISNQGQNREPLSIQN